MATLIDGNSDRIATIQSHDNDEALPPCAISVTARRTEAVEGNQPKRNRMTCPLEVPVLLLFFSWNLTATVFQNLILFQTCTAHYSLNSTFCVDLTNSVVSNSVTSEVVKYATNILMARVILESIIPAFISFFIGPWSDKYGRKPLLLSTFLGYFLIYFCIALISSLSTMWFISPWYYLLAYIPISILGGTCALITSIYCFITDVSSPTNRAFRLARMEAAVFVGLLTGALCSIPLYSETSASVVFAVAALITFCGLIIIYFFVNESLQCPPNDIDVWTKFKALFDLEHVAQMFRTCFKKRDGFDRAIIWLTIFACASAIFILEGSVTLSYLFMREKFDWTIGNYNTYAATNIIVQVAGNVIGIYILSKMFGISEILIAAIAYSSSMTEYIIVGLANQSWQLYAASVIALLKGVAGPMSRSILASVVSPSEIGKVYSMTTTMESLSPIGAAPLYTFIFAHTIDTFPGAFNFLSAAIYLGCVLLIMLAYVLYRKRPAISYASIS